MSHDGGPGPADLSFLAGGGEMGRLIRAKDWAKTALGPIALWPQSLKIIIQVMLTSRYAMWLAWGEGLTFFCNDAYRPTLGVKQAWALGSPAEVVWTEIWPDIGPRIWQVMEKGEATWDEGLLLILGRSGYPEETYHTFSYSPVPGDAGGVSGMLCVVTEETDRVIGTRRLASLQALGSGLAGANAQDEVLATVSRCLADNQRDLPFTLTYLFEDGATRARLACSSAIAVGGPAAPAIIELGNAPTVWPTDGLARLEPAIVDDLATRFGDLPTGAWDKPPEEAVVVPIARSGQDRPAGFLVVAINPYRRLDAGYAGFIDLLAGQIAAGLANARAYEEERRRAEALAEIDRAKTTFFSNVSHEFRTPLTLMLGLLEEILAKPEKAEASRELAGVAHRNGLRLLKLVNSLLDFARIEAGRMKARYQATDLAAHTAELASNFRSATDKAGLRLVVACPPLPAAVHVDRDMWEKIVLNLLSNAFKFTFAGEIGVEVMPSADGTAAELIVRDSGTGIPPEELPHLFERFHRVEGAKGRTIEGSGIGLALVQELVRLHGGSIRVDSTPGKGSRFLVAIPFGTAHLPAGRAGDEPEVPASGVRALAYVEEALRWLPAEGTHAPAAEAPSRTDTGDVGPRRAARGHGERILLADDNPDMRDYARRLLVDDGYAVEAVGDGEAALTAARRRPPDIVVSDVMMPRLDGKALLAAIRADPALRHTPVLLLSARAGEEARIEGLESGADDYLTKPFSAVELLARVRGNLSLARARAETHRALEAKVTERTAELKSANERLIAEADERKRMEGVLRQAQKMEAIGQLTGGVAHDFNNLLTIILGNLETLTRHLGGGGDVARLKRATENALRGAQRAAALTQSLLAFSRRQPLNPKPVDANRLVTSMSDLLRRTLGEHIAVETVLAGGLWRTLADHNQLESALINLAVNARDAMPGGGRLTIETANAHLDEGYATLQAEVVPGQYVVVAMTDTGAGMTREVVAKAFDPFFTTKDVGHGTGLGLSQVYGFVKQTGGHVKIYSEVGQGTTVKIYLPRLLAGVDEVEPVEPAETLAGGDSSEIVLVVEDDEDVRAHTTDILTELGYRVLEAANARLGLDILERESGIRLLFTDVGLPGGMNGRRLADEARRRRPDLKVLFTTGYARNAIVHDGRLDPGVQLITKPFTYAALAAKLRDILDGDAAAEGPPCVLVVEDEVLIRMVTMDTLETLGFKVEEAGSATEAVDKMKSGTRIDVALVDMGLPDRKGDVLVGELRALQPKLRIVIASGYSPANLKKRVAEDRLTRFLAKPYDGRQLEAVLKDLGLDPPVPTPP